MQFSLVPRGRRRRGNARPPVGGLGRRHAAGGAAPSHKASLSPSLLHRRGRFKRSNSVTAGVQADLELEGFPGHVPTEDKGLQFGSSFQRHSEPSTPTQYGAVRTVRTQGLFSYREDYRAPADTATLPAPEPWLEPAVDAGDGGRVSPCRRDGSWFLKLLHTETQRMEGWCKEMEREAEDNDLAEESKSGAGRAQPRVSPQPQPAPVRTGFPARCRQGRYSSLCLGRAAGRRAESGHTRWARGRSRRVGWVTRSAVPAVFPVRALVSEATCQLFIPAAACGEHFLRFLASRGLTFGFTPDRSGR